MKRTMCLILLFLLVACNGATTPDYKSLPATGDAEAGRLLFDGGTQKATACSACHSVDGRAENGPSLRGIADMAASRVPGQSAEAYLYSSLVEPDRFLVPGYAAGIMPRDYGKLLSLQQQRDLINYLLTLTNP